MNEWNKVKRNNEITLIIDQNAAILSSPDFVSSDARITSWSRTNEGVKLCNNQRLISPHNMYHEVKQTGCMTFRADHQGICWQINFDVTE